MAWNNSISIPPTLGNLYLANTFRAAFTSLSRLQVFPHRNFLQKYLSSFDFSVEKKYTVSPPSFLFSPAQITCFLVHHSLFLVYVWIFLLFLASSARYLLLRRSGVYKTFIPKSNKGILKEHNNILIWLMNIKTILLKLANVKLKKKLKNKISKCNLGKEKHKKDNTSWPSWAYSRNARV